MKTIVYAPGVWDLLHIGHIKSLEHAKKFGDILIVGVQDDEDVMQCKGDYPVISLENRVAALEALGIVDLAVPYKSADYLATLKKFSVDVLVLSEEYEHAKRFEDAINYLKEKNGKVIYLPYWTAISSSKIKEKIISGRWGPIWEKVANSSLTDYEVNSSAYTPEKIKQLSEYFMQKLQINSIDSVLDYGCGSGLILKNIQCKSKFGVDVAEGMIRRALKNCPEAIYAVSDNIPFRSKFDHVISYGVFHYLPSYDAAKSIIETMLKISDSILIMDIPDIERQVDREINRRLQNKNVTPKQLYFNKQFFTDLSFEVTLN
jgi:cytidyltransferase-like protein